MKDFLLDGGRQKKSRNEKIRNLKFSIYLRKCKQHVVKELVEIDVMMWMIIAVFLTAELYLFVSNKVPPRRTFVLPDVVFTGSALFVGRISLL